MSNNANSVVWKVVLDSVETRVAVGIHPQEKTPQRLQVDVEVEAEYGAPPASISECVDYEAVHDLIVKEWPKMSHVDLLETLALDAATFLFTRFAQVHAVKVGVYKPDIFAGAKRVGVELALTRIEFDALS